MGGKGKSGPVSDNQQVVAMQQQQALQGQLELRVLHLPAGKDPDEFLKQHSQADYLALQESAPLWLDWQIEQEISKSINALKWITQPMTSDH